MDKIKNIENDVRSLTATELATFRKWFLEFDADSGIQYTPVDSIATVSTRHRCSQSAKACRSSVNVGNDRTDSVSRSGGTATKISVAPISTPAAFGLITGKLRSNFRCFFPFPGLAIDHLPLLKFGNEPGVPKKEISQAGSSQLQRHQCYCARAWDQTLERVRRSKHQ